MEELLTLLFVIGIPAAIIAAHIYLQKQAKIEEQAFKLEMQQLVQSLPGESQSAFMIQYTSQEKKPTTAILFALLLGGLGAHKFYLGNTLMGFLYLIFVWTFIPGFIAFIEAFTLTKTVHRHNREVARTAAAIMGGDIKAFL